MISRESKTYYQESIHCASNNKSQAYDPGPRGDLIINSITADRLKNYKEILLIMVGFVLYYVRRQIGLRRHRDDKVKYTEVAAHS